MYVNMYELCEHVYVCKYAYMRIGMYTDVYTRIYVCIHVHTYMCGYVRVLNIRKCVLCMGTHRDIKNWIIMKTLHRDVQK